MIFRKLLVPFCLSCMAGLSGYLLLGGSAWLWIIGIWIGSAPFVIWWNWTDSPTKISKSHASQGTAFSPKFDTNSRSDPALAAAVEPTRREVQNGLGKNPKVRND